MREWWMPLFSGLVVIVATQLPQSGEQPTVEELQPIRVTIECPNVTCHGRFQESLAKHIVTKHDWIQKLSIRVKYPQPAQRSSQVVGELPNSAPKAKSTPSGDWLDTAKLVPLQGTGFGGQTTLLDFTIAGDREPEELAKTLVQSGYYSTGNWVLISRKPFSDLK